MMFLSQKLLVCILFISLGSTINGQQYDSLLQSLSSQPQLTAFVIDQLAEQFDLNSLLGLSSNGSSIDFLSLLGQYGDLTNYLTDFLQNYFDLSEFSQKMNNISEPCRNKTVEFVQALRDQKTWAIHSRITIHTSYLKNFLFLNTAAFALL
jgi:hypothetical protein